ncbi:PWWP domain-containing protein [Sesbania bispinosa]|nr:PWWP domain-containing protein [Sesbania bispinosa]
MVPHVVETSKVLDPQPLPDVPSTEKEVPSTKKPRKEREKMEKARASEEKTLGSLVLVSPRLGVPTLLSQTPLLRNLILMSGP